MAVRFVPGADGEIVVPVKLTYRLTAEDLMAALAVLYKRQGRVCVPATRTELVNLARGIVRQYGESYTATAFRGVPQGISRKIRKCVRELFEAAGAVS